MKTDMDVLDRLSGQKVIVFGDFMVDEYLQGSVSRVSPEAPVPVVLVQKQSRRLGGAGNVVLNLKALGAQATAVGLIGADTNGDWLIGQLKASGVDASGILRTRGIVTCTKTRITAQHQQLLRYDC